MEKQQHVTCSQCAYVKKESTGWWCPFHDEPVSSQLVCDDFLHELQAPLFTSLASDSKKVDIGVIIKDVIGYTLIFGLLLLATICTIGVLTQ